MKKPKSAAWYAAMNARKGKGTNQFTKARELSLPIPPGTATGKPGTMTGKKQSDESKQKISRARIKFLTENPDMVPYRLNHYSKGPSYPEIYWKGILDSNNISYISEYPVNRYQLDFAIVDRKIDLEIDGDQHYLDPRIVESDKKRTEYLESLGWQVIRIKWSDYKSLDNKEEFVKELLSKLHGPMVK